MNQNILNRGGGTTDLNVSSQGRTYLQAKVGAQLDKYFKANGMQFYAFAKLTYSQQKGLKNS
ncbi:MAG: hypothetical protein K0M45_09090 [Candidatus Paracaedibacteraceae bacterium]|nr:hypothetical protein [Candidatus Paracaedibacteraceae bacterium]